MKISVILITYNQEPYIRQALESILQQRFTGEIEVIIADDCSTDSTLSIIRSYEDKSPFPFLYLQNQSNLGISRNYKRAFAACSGQYLAILEGDDYWCNSLKLEKLVDFLDIHQECVMAMNSYISYFESSQQFIVYPNNKPENVKYVTFHEMLFTNMLGNLSSCVIRKASLDKTNLDLFDIHAEEVDDWLIGLAVSQFGLIVLINEVMTIYRVHENGLWSGLNTNQRYESFLRRIQVYDQYFKYKYTKEFTSHYSRIKKALNEENVKQNWPPIIIYFRNYTLKISNFLIKIPFLFIPKKLHKNIKSKLRI